MSDQHPAALPPVATRKPNPTTLHGVTLHDDYAWMRDKSSPELLAHLEAENRYTAAVMAPTEPLQAALYAEMLSHIKETDESVPVRDGSWFYTNRTVEGSQYPIYCRRPATPAGTFDPAIPEEILLDVNQLAEGHPYMAVGSMAVSPDNTLLAYTTDTTGFRQYTLHLRDLRTGQDLPDTAQRTGSLAWAVDSRTLFYTTEDEQTKRHNKLFRHTVASPTPDPLVFEELDERFNLGVGRTRDRHYLLIESASHTTSEYRFLPTGDPLASLTLIAPRIDDQQYYPDHRQGLFLLRANDTTRNFRLLAAPVATPGREHWRELYLGPPDTPLEDFDLFQSFCVLSERKAGLPTLAVYPLAGPELEALAQSFAAPPQQITFPEPTYTAATHDNREFTATKYRYSYTSLVSPPSIYDYDLQTRTSTLLKQQEVPGNFNPANYASERLWIEAPDGTKIPVSLVYRKVLGAPSQTASPSEVGSNKLPSTGSPGAPSQTVPPSEVGSHNSPATGSNPLQTHPLYLYGYGSYGFSLPVSFSPTRLALLDRGLILAYAHIRGGGELGDQWHDAGKMQHKLNTFTDFIAVTESLTAQGYGDPTRVAIEGGSAGGLLLGAVVNLRPDLFRVVLSHVPFVDVMNTMLDASLPLTVAEYEEWGNPNLPADFTLMHSYSPYENLDHLDPTQVPAMLVKTSLNDSQVMYWEPAKYVAKLRTLKQDRTPLLLHINMEAGHGGASGRYDYLHEIAFDYAFLLTQLGIAPKS